MQASSIVADCPVAYELRFEHLREDRALAFPCDAGGHVDMDQLSDRVRDCYLYARAVVGHQYSKPAVRPRTVH